MNATSRKRCAWPGADPLMLCYHDKEWGTPVHEECVLFEFLILEGAQAGLSWSTILNKREGYRRAFREFHPARVARMTEKDAAGLMNDPGIVRNRLKIAGALQNAKAFLAVQKEFGSFDEYVWRFVGGAPIQHRVRTARDIPVTTPESDAMSQDLRRRGFKFVGSTICYAFMQAVGMVNDHHEECFRRAQVARLR